MDILTYMGISMAKDWDHVNRKLPEVWQKLAKIPDNIYLLKDKGFSRTEKHYQNLNRVKTSLVMRNRNIKQHHQSELKPKADLCRLRYT